MFSIFVTPNIEYSKEQVSIEYLFVWTLIWRRERRVTVDTLSSDTGGGPGTKYKIYNLLFF